MQYYQPLLLTPGPTPVPEQILSAVQLPMVGHRSTDFEEIASEAKYLFLHLVALAY